MDKYYSYVWRKKNAGPTLWQMKLRNTSYPSMRESLSIKSIRMKIEKRSLERIGHVMRMEDTRLTKKITLGWLHKRDQNTGNNNENNNNDNNGDNDNNVDNNDENNMNNIELNNNNVDIMK